jgi:2-iminobutanoate/2-iminopropanoate deaminase
MKSIIKIPNAPAPIGPYSQAVLKNDTLYVSGQIPIDPHSRELKVDNLSTATQQVMENIKALIETADFKMTDIVKCSIFLRSMNDFKEVNTMYENYFQSEPPARETVAVKELPKDAPVEISCIAIR